MSEHKRIGSLAKIRRGASPRPIGDPKYFGGDVGWVRIVDVTRHNYKYLRTTEQYLSSLGQSKSVAVNQGDLIMSICATVGKPIIVDMAACIHDGFVQFYNLSGIDTEYLFYQLQFHEKDFIKCAQPGTQINLNTQIVQNEKIFVPQRISTQSKIAAVLRSVDQAIQKTEALIQKYQQIKQGLMHDLFTRGVTPDGKLRPTREQTPELYEETPIGWIPKEWELKPLTTVAIYQHGRPFPSTEYSNEGVILLRPGNLHNSGLISFDEAHTTRIPQNWIAKCPSYIVKFDDILMNLTAQSLEDQFLGRVCLNKQQEPSLLNQRIARFKATNIDHYFLYWILRSETFRSQIDRTTKGTKVQHLYNEDLNRVILGIPKEAEEQKQISKRLFACLDQIELHSESLKKYIMLKSGLMHDLLTGIVKVKVDE